MLLHPHRYDLLEYLRVHRLEEYPEYEQAARSAAERAASSYAAEESRPLDSERDPDKQHDDARDEVIEAKWRAGWTTSALASYLNLADQTVYNLVSGLRAKHGEERFPRRRPKTGK